MSFLPTPVATPTQDDPLNVLAQNLSAPQNEILGLQGQQALDQSNFGIAQNQLGSQQAQQSFQNQLAQLLLRQQGFGIDQAALLRQFNPQTQGGLIPQEQNLANQNIAQALAQAQFSAQEQDRSAYSSATARGATNTQGFSQNLSDIQKQLGFTEAGIGRQQQQSDLQFGEQRSALTDALSRLNLSMAHGPLPASPFPGMGGVDLSLIGLNQNLGNAQQGFNINNQSLGSAGTNAFNQVPLQQAAGVNQTRTALGATPGFGPGTPLPPPPPPPGAPPNIVSRPGGRRAV